MTLNLNSTTQSPISNLLSYDMLSRLPAAIPHPGHGPSLEPRAPSPSRLAASAPIGDRTRRCRPSDVEPRAVSALAQSASRFAAPTAISAGASMSVGEARKQPASRLLGSLNRRVFVANEHW